MGSNRNKKNGENLAELDILFAILENKTSPTSIAKRLNIPRKTIYNRLKKLLDKKYIKKDRYFNTSHYKITPKGKEILNSFTAEQDMTRKGLTITAHKVVWYFDISKKPKDIEDQLRHRSFSPSMHNTWAKYSKQEYEDAKIIFNPQKVYVYLDEFFLKSPMEYYEKAISRMNDIKDDLENKFPGLVLGTPERKMVVQSNHVVRKNGPLAQKFLQESIKKGEKVVYHGKNLDIDFSQGEAEEETKDSKSAPAHLEDLGKFFDDWLENPILLDEIHEAKDNANHVEELKSQLDTTKSTADLNAKKIEVIPNLKREVTSNKKKLQDNKKQFTELRTDMSQMQHTIEKTNKKLSGQSETMEQMAETLRETTRAVNAMGGSIQSMADNNEKFAKAMEEHLTLVKSLQEVAFRTREGMEYLTDNLGVQLGRELGQQINEGFSKLGEQLASKQEESNKQMLELLKEMNTPWYEKLGKKIKSFFSKDD